MNLWRTRLAPWLRRHWFAVALSLAAVYASLLVSGAVRQNLFEADRASTLHGWDSSFYYFWLRSLLLDGDVDFSNDAALTPTLSEAGRAMALEQSNRTDSGLVRNKYPLGWALFHAPFFLAAHGASLTLAELGADLRVDGYGRVYELFIYCGSLLYAALAMWFSFRLLRRFFGGLVSLEALLVFWLSGFLIYYQLHQHGMAHGLAYLCLVCAFHWTFEIEQAPLSRRSWFFLGLFAGLLLITRPQATLCLLFPFASALRSVCLKGSGAVALRYGVPAFAALLLAQLLAWRLLYAEWTLYTYSGEGFSWDKPQIAASLFSPFHGLVYWHPIFGIGALGLIGFAAAAKDRLIWLMFASIAGTVYLNASWHSWWFGAAFGGRAYEGISLFAVLGLAWLAQRAADFGPMALGGLRLVLLALAAWNLGILEVCVYDWQTGIDMELPVTYERFWQAIRERWL